MDPKSKVIDYNLIADESWKEAFKYFPSDHQWIMKKEYISLSLIAKYFIKSLRK